MLKKPRPPRIESPHESEIEDESGHLWAISYADFLMVLLSFFILFFSVDEQTKKSVIDQIVDIDLSEMKNKVRGASGKEDGATQGEDADGRDVAALPKVGGLPDDALESIVSGMEVEVEPTKKSLRIIFPDNIYEHGEIDLGYFQKKELEELLGRLKPYLSEVEVVFVGHTDATQIRGSKRSSLLRDNFDLSVLRASKALQFALDLSLPASQFAAKGSASGERNTRSLSIIIRENPQ